MEAVVGTSRNDVTELMKLLWLCALRSLVLVLD